jgi:tRNA threonylcarbamoyladenosine biosynthesis protein TsaE
MLGRVVVTTRNEAETRQLAREVGRQWSAGDIVLLAGPLGAGKTTFVRGYLESLGHLGPVRSPTFNLVQVFATVPPVVHLDLYRVDSPAGLDFFELVEGRVALVEWPDRLAGWIDPASCWRVTVSLDGDDRIFEIAQPAL